MLHETLTTSTPPKRKLLLKVLDYENIAPFVYVPSIFPWMVLQHAHKLLTRGGFFRQSRKFSSSPSSFLRQPRDLSLQKVGESSEKMIFDSTQKSPQGIGKPQASSPTYCKNNLVELRYSVLEHFTQLPCLRPRGSIPSTAKIIMIITSIRVFHQNRYTPCTHISY